MRYKKKNFKKRRIKASHLKKCFIDFFFFRPVGGGNLEIDETDFEYKLSKILKNA